MRKIAQIAYSGPSGAADLGVTLALAGQAAGVNQTIAFWGVESCPPDRLKRCAAAGIPTQVFTKKYGSDWGGQGALKQWIASHADADAFIVHYPASLLPLRSVFKGKHRPRVILVEHNSILMKRPHHWVLSGLAFMLCDGVVYLTDSYRDQTAKKLGPIFRRHKATVIANGLDLSACPQREPAALKDAATPFTIGMSGRMAAAKDYATLLDAFALLVRRMEQKKVAQPAYALTAGDEAAAWRSEASDGPRRLHLELAGDGQLRPGLEEQATRLGIRQQVTFSGHLPHAELLRHMARWDAFVLSTHGETQPLALMEAMAIGLPCAATDVPGVHDLVIEGKNGLLAPILDAARLSEALEKIVEDPELAGQIARSGQEYVLSNFSAHSMWHNYHKFIDSINTR